MTVAVGAALAAMAGRGWSIAAMAAPTRETGAR
jgi:hypothetical protein